MGLERGNGGPGCGWAPGVSGNVLEAGVTTSPRQRWGAISARVGQLGDQVNCTGQRNGSADWVDSVGQQPRG